MKTNDPRYSPEAFDFKCKWEKALAESSQELPTGYQWHLFWLFCLAFARHGANGLGCWPSDATIAKEMRLNRDTVSKYKRLAVDLRWLTWTGVRHGRAKIHNISIPTPSKLAPTVVNPHSEVTGVESAKVEGQLPDGAYHDGWAKPATNDCPACKFLLSQDVEHYEVRTQHAKAVEV